MGLTLGHLLLSLIFVIVPFFSADFSGTSTRIPTSTRKGAGAM